MEFEIVERGCGFPQEGGLYFGIGTGPDGVDPREFLIDPIYSVDEKLGVKPRGLTLIKKDGIWHVVDHIGENNYPNFPDWFEETARYGFHQRVETTLDFSKLDPINSRWLVVHPRAYISSEKARIRLVKDTNWSDASLYVEVCPRNRCNNHEDRSFDCCAGLSWLHIVKGEEVEANLVRRVMPSFSYLGFESIGKLKAEPGFVASFPISMMTALIYRGKDSEHEKSARVAKAHGLWDEPVFVG